MNTKTGHTATPLNKSGKGFKIFVQCWTTLSIWQVSNKLDLIENTQNKNLSDAFAVILPQQRPVFVSAHDQKLFSWSSAKKSCGEM